jgi:hypothetical protein
MMLGVWISQRTHLAQSFFVDANVSVQLGLRPAAEVATIVHFRYWQALIIPTGSALQHCYTFVGVAPKEA